MRGLEPTKPSSAEAADEAAIRKLDIREGWGIVCKTWFWPGHAINVLKVITDSNFIQVGPVPEERGKRKLNSGVRYAGKHVCYAVILGET